MYSYNSIDSSVKKIQLIEKYFVGSKHTHTSDLREHKLVSQFKTIEMKPSQKSYFYCRYHISRNDPDRKSIF